MLRTTLVSSIIFLSLSSNTYSAQPYLGTNLDFRTQRWTSSYYYKNNIGGGVFGGTGTKVGRQKNIYLGGEVNLDYLSRASLGVSFIPGYMVTQSTMVYGRYGLEGALSSPSKVISTFGTKLGVGVQTSINKHWDVRTEYASSVVQNANQVNFGLLYKFD